MRSIQATYNGVGVLLELVQFEFQKFGINPSIIQSKTLFIPICLRISVDAQIFELQDEFL
jgi:hypothetical protein